MGFLTVGLFRAITKGTYYAVASVERIIEPFVRRSSSIHLRALHQIAIIWLPRLPMTHERGMQICVKTCPVFYLENKWQHSYPKVYPPEHIVHPTSTRERDYKV